MTKTRTFMTLVLLVVVAVVAVLAEPAVARADEYVVGSGSYPDLASVPWSSLGAGDIVSIPYSASPYRETFAITTSGTAAMPITVRGIAGPGGARPIIDGENAVAGADAHVRGLLSVRSGASNVVIEGLLFRHAHPAWAHAGLAFGTNASGIYVEDGAHVTVRDCEFTANGNGFFTAPGTSDIHFERNYVHGNGNVGSTQEHNSYTESEGIVFEGNRYGPLLAGALGTGLKDRSSGTVIRYNFIEGGGRTLDLVEADTADSTHVALVANTPTYVYGNVLIKNGDTTQSQVVHFGGDNGDSANYRRYLYFYGNTVYSTRSPRTTFFFFNADAPVVDVRDSVFVTPLSSEIYLLDSSTTPASEVRLDHVYLPPTWAVSVATGLASTLTSNVVTTGTTPGFVDAAAFDFHLVPAAAVRNGGTDLAAGAPTLLREYAMHQDTIARQVDGPLDLGAFEVCETGCMVAVPLDAGVPAIDAGAAGDAGNPGADAGPPSAGGSDGCGCTVAGARGPERERGLFVCGVLALGLVSARTRSRRTARALAG